MTDLVTISIAVSRAEALVVASMLEGYGIPVHIGGDRQGSTEYWSQAFGGYRLWISEDDHVVASEIIQQSGVLDDIPRRRLPRWALVRFLLVWLGIKLGVLITSSISTSFPIPVYPVGLAVLDTFMVPVNPQGKADYFLVNPS